MYVRYDFVFKELSAYIFMPHYNVKKFFRINNIAAFMNDNVILEKLFGSEFQLYKDNMSILTDVFPKIKLFIHLRSYSKLNQDDKNKLDITDVEMNGFNVNFRRYFFLNYGSFELTQISPLIITTDLGKRIIVNEENCCDILHKCISQGSPSLFIMIILWSGINKEILKSHVPTLRMRSYIDLKTYKICLSVIIAANLDDIELCAFNMNLCLQPDMFHVFERLKRFPFDINIKRLYVAKIKHFKKMGYDDMYNFLPRKFNFHNRKYLLWLEENKESNILSKLPLDVNRVIGGYL
jgi:hypothetical protein